MLVNAFETARWKTGYAPKNLCSSRCALVAVQFDGVFCLCAPTSLGRKIDRLANADRLRGRGSLYDWTEPKTETRRAATPHSKEPRDLEPDGATPGRESRSGPLAIELR